MIKMSSVIDFSKPGLVFKYRRECIVFEIEPIPVMTIVRITGGPKDEEFIEDLYFKYVAFSINDLKNLPKKTSFVTFSAKIGNVQPFVGISKDVEKNLLMCNEFTIIE